MKRFKQTTAIALVLALSGQTASQATTFNTTPLGATGQPIPAFHGNTTPLGATGQPIPAFHGNTTPLSTTGQPVTKTLVTTAAGLLAGGSTFAVPNVKATIATGPITVPKAGTTSPQYGPYSGDGSSPATGDAPPNGLPPTVIGSPESGLTNLNFNALSAANAASTPAPSTTSAFSLPKGVTNLDFNALSAANAKSTPAPSTTSAFSLPKGLTNLDFNALSAANNPKQPDPQTAGGLTLGSARRNNQTGALVTATSGLAGGAVGNGPPAHNLDSEEAAQANLGIVGVPGVNGTAYAIPQSTSNGGQSSNGGQPAIGSLAGINLANAFIAGAVSGGATTSGSGGEAGAANGGISGASNGGSIGGAQSAGPFASNGAFGGFLGSSSQQSNVPSGAFQTNANNASAKQAQFMVTAANNGDTQFTTVPPASLLGISGTTLSAGNSNGPVRAVVNVWNQAATNLNNQLNSMVPANDTSGEAQATRFVLTTLVGQPTIGSSNNNQTSASSIGPLGAAGAGGGAFNNQNFGKGNSGGGGGSSNPPPPPPPATTVAGETTINSASEAITTADAAKTGIGGLAQEESTVNLVTNILKFFK